MKRAAARFITTTALEAKRSGQLAMTLLVLLATATGAGIVTPHWREQCRTGSDAASHLPSTALFFVDARFGFARFGR